jgi:pimeloyl-ACP methyl ester carboxylesterase
MVVWGTDDPITPFVNHEDLRELIPDSKLLILEGASHCDHMAVPHLKLLFDQSVLTFAEDLLRTD